MTTLRIVKKVVDGDVLLAVYVNDKWVTDVEVYSQFTEKQAREYIKQRYL